MQNPSSRQRSEQTRWPGIVKVHVRTCKAPSSRCTCGKRVRYQASTWSPRDGKRIRKHFKTEGEAKGWREDATRAVRRGELRAPTKLTIKQAADALIEGMRSGAILDRSGEPYKPSTTRTYDISLRLRVLPAVGHVALCKLERRQVQALVDGWREEGLMPSTIANQLDPIRVLYRHALHDGDVTIDPTSNLRLAAVRGRRTRVAGPAEAVTLLGALAAFERALWGTAMYAGLRYGELRALRWWDVDLEKGKVHVLRSWDQKAGVIPVKTEAGLRSVPVIGALRRILVEHKLATGRGGDDLVFGRTAELVFTHSTVYKRALKAWKAAKLTPIGLHESRHTAASTMIAAGANMKQVSTYMGHANIKITLDRYGHLLDGDDDRFIAQMDEFLEPTNGEAEVTPIGSAKS